jgi:hypothetical protein
MYDHIMNGVIMTMRDGIKNIIYQGQLAYLPFHLQYRNGERYHYDTAGSVINGNKLFDRNGS